MSNRILYLGTIKGHGRIYMSDFSFDCGWYWDGGWLGNDRCHYHFHRYTKDNTINGCDAIIREFTAPGCNLAIAKHDLWRLTDLMKQFYVHRASAKAFVIGGHQTSEGRKDCELSQDMADRINAHLRDNLIPVIREYCEELETKRKKRRSKK